MVGYARTARILGSAPPDDSADVIKKRRMDYYRYMAEGPRPVIAVIEDVDFPDCVGAYWGEVNTEVHKGFGLSGALTNSVMPDLGDLPKNFTVLAGSIGPSHGFVHVVDFDQPIEVFGLTVKPDDLIHADRHGAVVIPENVLPTFIAAIEKLLSTEKLVLDPARAPGFNFEVFEEAWTAF
jgi:regulator of RNase E activity RraA